MKKVILALVMGVMLSLNATAQSDFTLNTRAWSTNYLTTIIYDVAHDAIGALIINDPDQRNNYSRILPNADLVFPVGIVKEGFDKEDIYGSYHRAFKNPFTKPGDFGIGLDASWKPWLIGVYAGGYFKSQELCFVPNDENMRSFYFQPRAGIILGQKTSIEAGVYYDMVVGAGGTFPNVEKEMFSDGLGLDFALSFSSGNSRQSVLTFMLPLHNFLNEDYGGGTVFKGMDRRVGYIMFTQRIGF